MPGSFPVRFLLCVFLCSISAAIPVRSQGVRNEDNRTKLANLPINFEPNQGQAEPSARFVAHAPHLSVSLRSLGIDLFVPENDAEKLGIDFVASNRQANIVASELAASETNYLIGNDPARWHTHVPNFGRITYSSVYPGIDLVFYGNGEHLEHDFIVAPNANYRAIRLRLKGSPRLQLQTDGSLTIALTGGNLIFQKPQVYQLSGDMRESRDGQFVLFGDREFGFAVKDYDRSRPLIIDPILSFSTYLANLSLVISGVATDVSGNTFVTGLTFSSTFPVTPGAYQQSCSSCANNNPDVFITKLNASGTGLVYSTFLGGSSYDQASGITVDANGNAVVAGYTQSTDFPVKNPVMQVNSGVGTNYTFITSLSPNGSALNYSSLLGGGATPGQSATNYTGGVALDGQGNAFISGTTDSSVFPVTSGALNLTPPLYPREVVFVTKFLTNGTIGYSALLGDVSPQNGGGGLIGIEGIAVDALGSAYIAGSGGSLWPTTPGAHQRTIPGAAPYAAPFVAKLSPTGSAFVYSTFLGDGGYPTAITVKPTGEAFVTGNYATSNFPTTPNAFETTTSGNCCASFFTEFNAAGSALLYSSYFSGPLVPISSSTFTTGIALDTSDNIWLSGATTAANFPLKYPLQSLPANSGGFPSTTGFISRFDPTGAFLTFSSYFGGQVQGGTVNAVAIDPNNNAHIVGTTGTGLFTTPGAFLPSVTPAPQYVQYTYGYAAVIDANTPAPSVCLNSQGLFFGAVRVATSASQTVTITNCGNQSLTITSVQSSDPSFAIPAASNNCQQAVNANASCTFLVVFTPASVGNFTAALSINANTPIPQTFPAQGAGAVPQIQVQRTIVTFDPQFIGQTSPQQQIVISNVSSVPLTINLAQTTISAGFAYTQSGCNQPVYSACFMSLTFTPSAAGTLPGTLTITSDDPRTPVVTVQLSGTGYSSYPVPSINTIVNPTLPVGNASVSVSVSGSNFFPASVLQVGGVPQTTSYQSSTFLTATLAPSLLANPGELQASVFNPSPGGGQSAPVTLTVYQALPIAASALAYDPFSRHLFASIRAGAANNPNTIAVIDPATGTVLSHISVGNDPQRLALSDDGQYLYVALNADHAVQRINLAAQTVEKTFQLPVDPTFGLLTVADIKVVPGSPQSFVVALFRLASPAEDGIALFNDTGLISYPPTILPTGYVAVDNFVFAGNPPVIYSTPGLGVFTIDSAGLHQQPSQSLGGSINGVLGTDGALLYTNSGVVWNPMTQSVVGNYIPALSLAPSIIPDDSLNRTFFLNPYNTFGPYQATTVDAYDQSTFALTGSVPFMSVYGPDAIDLTRWGADGFAFIFGNFVSVPGSDQVILFRSSIARVSATQNPTPALSSLGPSSVIAGSTSFVIGVTGSNFVRGSIVQWNGSPRVTTYVSGTQLNAAIPASDISQPGTAQITVVNPAPGGGTSTALTLTITAPPVITLTPSSLTFAAQTVATSSTVQIVTLSNTGAAPLVFSGIQASGDFVQTNNCPPSLAPSANCVVSVTFTPTMTGARQGVLTLSDNASGSPQSVLLSGTGSAPTFSFGSGNSVVTTATVTAGQTAIYSLSIAADPTYSGTLALSCTQVPQNAKCTLSAPSVVLKGGNTANFTVSVTTGNSISASLRVTSLVGAYCGVFYLFGFRKRRIITSRLFMIGLLAVFACIAGCGGGNPSSPNPTSVQTPPGTYSLQVVASDGLTSHTQIIQLIVR